MTADEIRKAITDLVQSTVEDPSVSTESADYQRGFSDGMRMVVESVVSLVLAQVLAIGSRR